MTMEKFSLGSDRSFLGNVDKFLQI